MIHNYTYIYNVYAAGRQADFKHDSDALHASFAGAAEIAESASPEPIVAIFYPFSQFCEIVVSLPSL